MNKLPEVTPLPLRPPERDRLTMVLSLHHEQPGNDTHSVESRCWKLLDNPADQERQTKRIKVDENWSALWLGDLEPDQVGYIVVENNEGRFLQVNPTDEERLDISKRVVEIGLAGVATLLVLPGFPQQLYPQHVEGIRLRCQHGVAKCRVTIFPK